MELKGQKFNKYSAEIKNIILEELKNGYSCRFLSRKYNISEKTISTDPTPLLVMQLLL